MSPKRAARRVAAVAGKYGLQGADPRSFHLAPYWEDRTKSWQKSKIFYVVKLKAWGLSIHEKKQSKKFEQL